MPIVIKNLLEHKSIKIAGYIYTAVITIAFLFPFSAPSVKTNLPVDKVVHVLLSAGLAFIWFWIYHRFTKNNNRAFVLAIFTGCLLYGIIIEILQEQFTTTRNADIFDVAANFIGYVVGYLLFLRLCRYLKN